MDIHILLPSASIEVTVQGALQEMLSDVFSRTFEYHAKEIAAQGASQRNV